MVYLLPFFSYLAGAQRVSDRPSDCPQPVRPGYDYKYRSRSYRFAERQKLLSASGMNNVAFRIAKLNGGLLLSKLERFMLFDKALAFWGAGHLLQTENFAQTSCGLAPVVIISFLFCFRHPKILQFKPNAERVSPIATSAVKYRRNRYV